MMYTAQLALLYPCLRPVPWNAFGNGNKAPCVLNLSNKWRWVVSFTIWLYSLYSRLDWPQD